MKQNRKLLVFLLVIISASIVATGLFFGLRTKSNAVITEPLWQKIGNDIDGEESDNLFGSSVSFSSDGKTVAVGAPSNGGNGYYSGHVRIFQWIESNSTWTQVGADIDGEAPGDYSGRSVSLSSDGKTVAIGAAWNGFWSGHVRIFQWTESSSTWTQVGADIDGEAPGDQSGESVSLSSDGKTVAIGAAWNDGNGVRSGHVRIFQWIESNSTWTQVGADIDGDSPDDLFGGSVSLSSDGKTVAIGAEIYPGYGDLSSNYVRIFQWTESTSTWTQMGADIDGVEVFGYNSGEFVSLSSDGKTVAIGAPSSVGNVFDSGHVRIFQWTESTSTWTQMGENIDGEAAYDDSGRAVSLSSDGKTVAIGAPENDGNGVNSGHVRIFQWIESTSTWTQVGADIDGELWDRGSGTSVSLSSDGNTVAIGAPRKYDGNGFISAGHVRIFQRND